MRLLLLILITTVLTRAENWPQFRGPNHQGNSAETGISLEWSATSGVVWKTEIPGEGWSSPIVWGDRVFLTATTDGGQSCRVLCVERATGKIAWNKEVFRQTPGHKQSRNTYATPTAATDGERVYACFGDGSLVALSMTGEAVWTNRDYPFYGEHGLASSPILHDGLLIQARDGSNAGEDKALGWQKPWDQAYVLALDTTTGKERWKGRRGLSRISHGVPNVWTSGGKTQIVSEAGDVLQGFDAATGQRLWSSEVRGEGKVPSVVIAGDLAFTSGGWGGKEAIQAFRLGGSGELKETNLVWEQRKGMPKIPSLIYVAPHLFTAADGGVATCLKAATGELLWRERLNGNCSASPVSAEGRLYFLGDDGTTTVLEAGPQFKVLAKNALGEKAQASPAVSGRHLFLRTEKHLWCIGK